MDPERVPLYVNAAHAVVVPSEREGFGLSVLARDVHDRGTYAAANKVYDTAATFNTTNGIALYPLGDDDLDTPTTGYDFAVTPPTAQTHLDPSGILYRTHLTLASSDRIFAASVGFAIVHLRARS